MRRLNDLKLNEERIIADVNVNSSIKKRLLDLGITKGSKIKPLFNSLGNNMIAYNIKGTIIAIRKEDTKNIMVIK